MTGDNNGRWAGEYSWPLDHAVYLDNADSCLDLKALESLAFRSMGDGARCRGDVRQGPAQGPRRAPTRKQALTLL